MTIQLSSGHKTELDNYGDIEQRLSGFSPVYLSDLSDAALLNRVDTKYLIPIGHLGSILDRVQANYRVLDINHIRLNRYHTVYYDNPDFKFYTQHHNRYGDRYKVRSRRYVDSNIAFFEVKHKTNKKRTIKSRVPLETEFEMQPGDLNGFIEHHVPAKSDELEAKLWNDYLRFTLVDQSKPERVTIDLALEFGYENTQVHLPGFAIAEVKQKRFTPDSHFIHEMRRLGIRSSSFSKYCAGVYLLYDNVKTNNFKPVMRKVQKMVEMEIAYAGVS